MRGYQITVTAAVSGHHGSRATSICCCSGTLQQRWERGYKSYAWYQAYQRGSQYNLRGKRWSYEVCVYTYETNNVLIQRSHIRLKVSKSSSGISGMKPGLTSLVLYPDCALMVPRTNSLENIVSLSIKKVFSPFYGRKTSCSNSIKTHPHHTALCRLDRCTRTIFLAFICLPCLYLFCLAAALCSEFLFFLSHAKPSFFFLHSNFFH